MTPNKILVYQCGHESRDPLYESPRKPSVLKKIKRALTFTAHVRYSSDLCPRCQKIEDDERAQLQAKEQSRVTQPQAKEQSRVTQPLRPRTSPSWEPRVRERRRNTVACAPIVESEYEDYMGPQGQENPYADANMGKHPMSFDAAIMLERKKEGEASESPAERHARHQKMNLVHRDISSWVDRNSLNEEEVIATAFS